jgi:hypothetical protein
VKERNGQAAIVVALHAEVLPEEADVVTVLVEAFPEQGIREIKGSSIRRTLPKGSVITASTLPTPP